MNSGPAYGVGATGFPGKVAIVTGAANGFGLAVSTRLTKQGARVVMVDRAAE